MIESDDFEKSMHTSKYRKEYIPEVSFVNTMLEKILGSKSKIRILRSILKNPKRSYSMEDIVKDTGMSFGTVHPAMQNLVNSRIIVTQKIGRSIAYKINRTHILFQDIKALFKSETSVFKEKAIEFVKLVEKKGLENIILFGSVAREEVIEAGDIDLLFIYMDAKVEQKIEGQVMDFLEKYDIVISPIFLSIKETKKRIKDLDDFILRTIEEGVILYGDKKWLKK
jgi:predicted nucleotidyltransferase